MPDPHIPVGQNMEHEAPYELFSGNGYDFEGVVIFSVSIPERLLKGCDREKERIAAGDPAFAIQRKSAWWDHAVEMKMIQTRLIPCVKDGNKAQFTAKSIVRIFAELR